VEPKSAWTYSPTHHWTPILSYTNTDHTPIIIILSLSKHPLSSESKFSVLPFGSKVSPFASFQLFLAFWSLLSFHLFQVTLDLALFLIPWQLQSNVCFPIAPRHWSSVWPIQCHFLYLLLNRCFVFSAIIHLKFYPAIWCFKYIIGINVRTLWMNFIFCWPCILV